MPTVSLEGIVVGRKRGAKLKGYLSVQETASKWDDSGRCREARSITSGSESKTQSCGQRVRRKSLSLYFYMVVSSS